MKYLFLVVVSLLAMPASAHHPLAGMPMETFAQGLLSGIGHPVLGFDHLFFVIVVGVAAVFTNRAKVAPMFFIGGMLVGVALILVGIQLPMVDLVIALSLLVLGCIVLAGKALSYKVAALLFAVVGVFHGWAFGGTLVGQESIHAMVVSGYLIGLALTLWFIAVAAGYVVNNIWHATSSTDIKTRLTGAVVAGVGATFTLELIENVVFSAIAAAV